MVVVDGKRKRARDCEAHLSPALQEFLPGRPASDGKPRCGAVRNGNVCKHLAGYGTQHPGYGRCKHHGGNTRSHVVRAAKLEAEAMAITVMGLPVDIDPMDALLQCVRISWGEVQYTSLMVAQLKQGEEIVEYREFERGENDFGPYRKKKRTTDTRLHAWITARQNALDRAAKFSKMALDAGVAERQVKIAEEIGGLIGRTLRGVLDELGLTDEQQERAPEIVQKHLSIIDGQALELEAA